MSLFRPLVLSTLLLAVPSLANAGPISAVPASSALSCPVASRYCQPGPAESGYKKDLPPVAVRAQMRRQFLPQCRTAMVISMGSGVAPVANAFCTCSVNTILDTPGEWRVLRHEGHSKKAGKQNPALAQQTQGQEKACMYAIASGTGLIAPKSGIPGIGLQLLPGTGSNNPNFAGGEGALLGQPYLPNR